MRKRAYDEWQGYDPDYEPPYTGGMAETLPLKEGRKVLSKYRQRLRKAKPRIGFTL